VNIRDWMATNRLKMNDDKTQVNSQWVDGISSVKSRRRNRMPRTVQFSAVVNDLRVLIDSELTMANHIAALSRSCSFHMRQFQMDFP